MAVWIAIVLGILQGLTAFLPVSSSGHLLLVSQFLNAPQNMFFNILLHLATLVAVVLFFWKDVLSCIRHPLSKQTLCILLSTFCTAGIACAGAFVPGLFDGVYLGPSFLASGVVVLASELASKKRKPNPNCNCLSATKAFVTGVVQGISVVPGLSRTGTTISTLKMFGMDNDSACSFSFLLSIPVLLGAIIFELTKFHSAPSSIGVWPCIAGFAFALVFGLLSLFLLKILAKKNKWWVFIPYLLAVGIATTIWQYI